MKQNRDRRNTPRAAVVTESLERRVLLAGVTLITHGYEPLSSNRPGWLDSMADAIVARAGSDTSVYDLRIARTSTSQAGVVSFSKISGPGFSNSTNAEAVVMLDWADASGIFTSYFDTADLAPLVEAYLTDTFPSIGINSPLADVPIHLIGHSRGASLVSELSKDLGQSGIWVDQLTTLDPHPVSPDPAVNVYSNVAFADNYYESNETTFDFGGSSVSNAHNTNLTNVDPSHSGIHAYYDGTIDTTATSDGAADGAISIDPTWYDYSGTGPRGAIGFDYSLIGGGSRPADGLATAFGGSASRLTIPGVAGAQWPNIGALTLPDSGSQFQTGTTLHAQFDFEDDDTTSPTVSLFLDNDQSPYDSGSSSYPVAGPTARSQGTAAVYHPTNPVTLTTTNVPAGQYYLYAEISDGTDTRYAYDSTPISLTNPPPATDSGVVFQDLTGNGITSDDTPLSGIRINLYQADGTTLVSYATSAADGSFSFGDLMPGNTYILGESVPTGWTQTSPSGNYAPLTVASGQNYTGNFGDFKNISISGQVLNDITGDGFSSDDTGLGSITVYLYQEQNGSPTQIQSAVTASSGSYSFNNLGPGVYIGEEGAPSGWTPTGNVDGWNVTAQSGQNISNLNFDNHKPSISIGGTVYRDLTGNGISSDDTAFNGAAINLYQSDGTTFIASTISAADGSYSFGGLAPGSYVWREVVPSGWTQTYGSGGWNATGTDGQSFTGNFDNFYPLTNSLPDLTGTLSNAPYALRTRGKNKAVLTLSNLGKVKFSGTFPINLYAIGLDGSGTFITSVYKKKFKLAAGKHANVSFLFKTPSNLPSGNYYLQADINPGQSALETNYTNDAAMATHATTIT